MKPSRARRKCLNCNAFFFPNPRAAERQRYCLKPECRQARRRALMRAWLAKPENQDYFRNAENAEHAPPGNTTILATGRTRPAPSVVPYKTAVQSKLL